MAKKKLTPEQEKEIKLLQANNEMLQKTSTTYAPWYILESVDKKYAPIKALKIIIDKLEKALD